MRKNTTIYDIARELGISPSTVSRVLNNSSHPVKAEIRERVLEMTQKMGYVPNAQARNLKMKTSTTIGVVLPSISNPFYPSIVRGMEDEAARRGYSITFASCDKNPQDIDRHMQYMLSQNVCGIITLYLEYMPQQAERYVQGGGRIVSLVEEETSFSIAHNICVDKRREAQLVTQHFIDMGHRRIAFLSDEIDCQIRKRRLEGVTKTLEACGLTLQKDYFVYINGTDIPLQKESYVAVGYDLMQHMLSRRPEVTGVLCMNDVMALGAMKALREHGLNVPGDYSLASFDDLFFAECIEPPLTTMRVEKYQWGQALVRYLLGLIDAQSEEQSRLVPENEVIEPASLVVRKSTAAPRG